MAHTNITRLDLRAAISVVLLTAAIVVIAAILLLSPAAHAATPGRQLPRLAARRGRPSMSPRINTSLSAGEIDQFRLLLEAAERSDGRPSVGAVDHLLEALRREHGPDGRPDLFMKRERPVILSTEIDGDLGIVPPKAARRLARIEADSLGVTVFIRDATTDLVVEVVTPSKRRR